MMLAIENDVLAITGLRIALQRIDLAYWSAAVTLRSWDMVPIMLSGDGVYAPCDEKEALWIGFWFDDDARSATISIMDETSGLRGFARCPEEFQLTTLSNGSNYPICRGLDQARRTFTVEVTVNGIKDDATLSRFELCLVEPQAWAKASGRPVPRKLRGPPPLPPRLG
jgi:hypothetical protein